MGRREAVLEQQPHRVALVAEDGLEADEDVAELVAEDEDAAPVRTGRGRGRDPSPSRSRAAAASGGRFRGGDAGGDVGGLAEAAALPPQDGVAQGVDGGGRGDVVAVGLHRVQDVVEAFEDAEVGGGADRAGVRREAVEDDGDPALRGLGPAEGRKTKDLFSQRLDAFRAGCHDAGGVVAGAWQFCGAAVAAVGVVAAGEDGGVGRAVDLGQRDQHRGLDRAEAAVGGGPLAEGLELERVRGDVGHVERGKRVDGGAAVVVGGAADEAEAGEGDEGVDPALRVTKASIAGRPSRPGGEGGDAGDAAGLERRDDGVVMRGVGGEDVGAQHQEADGGGHAVGLRAGSEASVKTRAATSGW